MNSGLLYHCYRVGGPNYKNLSSPEVRMLAAGVEPNIACWQSLRFHADVCFYCVILELNGG